MDTDKNGDFNGEEGVGQRFFRCMGKFQNYTGQIVAATGEKETYGEMLNKAIKTAVRLQSLGFREGDMITTCSYNHLNSCIPELASFFIGAIPSYLDPNLPKSDTISLLKLIEPKIIFVSLQSLNCIEECLSKANLCTEIVVFGQHDKYTSFMEFLESSPHVKSFIPVETKNVRETAVILFSSGTTGNPKGICLSHHTLLNPHLFEGIDECMSGSKSISLVYTTLYWISGLVMLIRSLLSGASRIICADFDPSFYWSILEKYKVELTFITPYQGIDCLACKPAKVDTSSVKIVFTGSCLVTQKFMNELVEAFPNAIVLNMYGMTELGGMISKFDPAKPEEVAEQRKKPQSVGRVQHYIKWKVVDPLTGEKLGPNQKGELLVKADTYLNGYYKVDSSGIFDDEGYLKTGDIVYYDEDYCFYIEDRIKEMFKYRGWHIMPSVLEEVVLSHPNVKDAVVVGLPHMQDGHHPMALVILKDNCDGTTTRDILEFVNHQVSEAQTLRGGVRISTRDLPRTATGKLKRQIIREMILKGEI